MKFLTQNKTKLFGKQNKRQNETQEMLKKFLKRQVLAREMLKNILYFTKIFTFVKISIA